jgi:D-alanyl-D-alanine carboxypeptidase
LVVVNDNIPYVAPADQSNLIALWDNEIPVNLHFDIQKTSMDKDALDAMAAMVLDFQKETDLKNVAVYKAFLSPEELDGLPADHLTGLGCLLKLVTEEPMEGEHEFETPMMVKYHDLSENEACKWLTENCHKYGFVVRYPADKAAVTGVSDYPDYFRYVGVPHATYMAEHNLCLEEYGELVKEHSKNAPLTVTAYGVTYLVFYADITQSLTVYYPAYHDYTWSGVGKDGVILTLTEKAE